MCRTPPLETSGEILDSGVGQDGILRADWQSALTWSTRFPGARDARKGNDGSFGLHRLALL